MRVTYSPREVRITSDEIQVALVKFRAGGGQVVKLTPTREPARVWVNPKNSMPKFESKVPDFLMV